MQAAEGSPTVEATAEDRRLAELRDQLGLDAILISSPNNTQYWTGCLILTQRLLPERLALVVNGPSGSTFVVCTIEEAQARAESRVRQIHGYTEFVNSPIAAVVDVLRDMGVANGRIGIEGHHLVAHYFTELRAACPQAELVNIDKELDRLRARKSPEEIALMRDAFIATDRAIGHSYDLAAHGQSTQQIAGRLADALRAGGADEVRFLVIGAGATTLLGHPEQTLDQTAEGDALRVDVGGSFHGYHSDLARSAFLGTARRDQLDAYRRLFDSLDDLIGVIRPGIAACEVFAEGQRALERNGLTLNRSNGRWELPHVGHGIGLAIHEFPMLQASEEAVLEAGMLLCAELLYTVPGDYRLHLEDAVLVTDTGAEILSRSRDWREPPVLGAG